jgi:hypothetical protein
MRELLFGLLTAGIFGLMFAYVQACARLGRAAADVGEAHGR